MAQSGKDNLRYYPESIGERDTPSSTYLLNELRKIASLLNNMVGGVHEPLWEDNVASISLARTGPTPPNWSAFGPGSLVSAYEFNRGESVYVTFHIKHDVKPGTIIYPHVHWSTDGTGSGNVEWVLTYLVAKGHQQEAFAAGSNSPISLVQTANATAWYHQIVEGTDPITQGIPMPEVDSLIIMKVERGSTNDTYSNTANGHVFGLMIDLHYQKDRDGTISKAPDFYSRG